MRNKTIGKREALRLAFANAAGHIENMDLEQMFGPTEWDDDNESVDRMAAAQTAVAAYLMKRATKVQQ